MSLSLRARSLSHACLCRLDIGSNHRPEQGGQEEEEGEGERETETESAALKLVNEASSRLQARQTGHGRQAGVIQGGG